MTLNAFNIAFRWLQVAANGHHGGVKEQRRGVLRAMVF